MTKRDRELLNETLCTPPREALGSRRILGGIVPGFKIVIASSVPAKRGLGSSSALVVATYTFLEALTGQPTLNIFEKALSCNLVEKLALQLPSLRLADILCSVFGDQRQILHFHAKILHLEAFPWRDNGVSLLVILPDSSDHDLGYFERAARCRKNTIILNTANRWNTRPIDFHKIDVLFPIELVNGARYISEEDVRVRRTLLAIQSESWTQLGAISTFDPLWRTCSVKDAAETFPCLNLPLPPETFQIGQILWESYYSILKYLDPVSIEIDYIVEALKGTNGVLGVNVIGRGYGGSVLALIKSEEREKISDALKDVKNMWKQCYILRPMKGASVLRNYHGIVALIIKVMQE
ncbi:galactokinase-like [Prorops nasuta]|uniref:galactokinase-like n=1 Tax=Prorops nasuta TaxID=863751 RepID=UPI0034CFEC32